MSAERIAQLHSDRVKIVQDISQCKDPELIRQKVAEAERLYNEEALLEAEERRKIVPRPKA